MGSALSLTDRQSALPAQAGGYDVVRFHRNAADEALEEKESLLPSAMTPPSKPFIATIPRTNL